MLLSRISRHRGMLENLSAGAARGSFARHVAWSLIFLSFTCALLPAQMSQEGVRIQSVSVSETYFTQAVPDGIVTYGDVFLGKALSLTESASINWKRTRSKSFWNFRFLPVFGNRFGDRSSNSWNGSFNLSYNRRLASKWIVDFTAGGQIMNFDESIFGPSVMHEVASSGASYDDLSSALLKGTSSDPQLTSIASGALRPNQKLETFLFGQRTANGGGQVALTYARSARVSLSFNAGGTMVRHLNADSDPVGFYYPEAKSINAAVALNYSMSPRMGMSFSGNYTDAQSPIISSTVRSFHAGFNRTMSRRWFMQASIGIGSRISSNANHLDGMYSVGLGFKTFSHTALVALDRMMDDPYAFAIAELQHTRQITGSWHYSHPGNPWWVDGEFSHLIAIYRGVPGTLTWSVTGKVGRRLGRSYAVMVEATGGHVGAKRYIFEGRQYQLHQTGIRTTFAWSPQSSLSR